MNLFCLYEKKITFERIFAEELRVFRIQCVEIKKCNL